ncbi:MAG: 30S ribosomal protein S3 [Methanobacteriota archaeon]|nr:MAG: 30S ribosomal protein S3 [Euryarchaeota archaeon]HIO25515.1 30S ribosomal protein S3 [Candidatus Poseidoniales archaeon]HIO86227.1 30S ribosomal protein S3 [Candidatus Poseidoniales archaeon]
MAKVNQIRHFVDRNVERQLVREYLMKETERAGFGGLHFERAFDNTSICTKVTLQAERVGMVIGRRGKIINELQRRIRTDFNLENPKLQVEEIENPALNAQVMASKLASALERGWYFRRAGHSSVLNVIEAGAKGCLIIIAGKLTGSRHRTEKFLKGHIKFCGETALTHMEVGQSTAVVKLGTIGCTVAIMKPGTKLPHEVDIISRIDAGLGPYVAPAMAGTEGTEDIIEESLSEEEAATELESLEKLQEDQKAVTEESSDDDASEETESEAEPAEAEPAEAEPAEAEPAEAEPADEEATETESTDAEPSEEEAAEEAEEVAEEEPAEAESTDAEPSEEEEAVE